MERQQWRRTRRIAVIVAASLVMASCSGDDEKASSTTAASASSAGSSTSTDSSAPSTSGSSTSGSTGSTAGGAEPTAGGDVTILFSNELRTLDPIAAVGTTLDAQRFFALYGALVTFLPTQNRVVPVLAESLTADSTFTTWTMKLRSGLKFSDGSSLDAAALVANWDRIKDPAKRSPGFGVMSSIASYKPIDDLTVEIVLVKPNSMFPGAVSRSALNYLASAKAIADGHDFTSEPIGAGPFVLDKWLRDSEMKVVRNPDYFDAPRPYVDSVTFRIVPDDEQRLDTLLTGDADMMYVQTPEMAERAKEKSYGAAGTVQADGRALTFNTSKPPFDDVRVRTAVAMIVDRQVVADVSNPGAPGADNFAVPGTEWYVDGGALPKHDVAAGTALIKEYVADKGGSLTFTIMSSQSPFVLSAAESIQTAMNQVDGVDVKIDALDTATFVPRVMQGDYESAMWGFPWVDPEPGLYNGVYGGLSTNYSKYSNPAVDAALEAARSTTDQAERVKQYTIVFDALGKDLPYLPLYHSESLYIHQEKLQEVDKSLFDEGNLRTDLMWLATS